MKRPTMLVEAILRQAAMDLDLSVERDIATLLHRFEHEGSQFLTLTLPLLSDALERGLEAGSFQCPTNFCRHRRLPRFLGGFFKRVFDMDGMLRQDSCPDAVLFIRQICRFFKKQKIGCTPSRELRAIEHFLEVEGELRRMTSQVERRDVTLDEISRIIWAEVFPELDALDLVCHHGPGFTADRYLPNERYRIRKWNHRSEFTFPSDLHCYPNYGAAAEVGSRREGTGCVEEVEYLRIREELPVRVVFVPKTQTAPRVIAIEPSHMQYMQQSVKDYVYKAIEGHRLTKRSIRFTRQDVNQRLAYSSSIDKRLATLDMKDASDRVHLHLVQRIFKTSWLLEYLEDARSLHATLPNGRNIVLFKYASMGSALCFPVEAMVFYTLIQVAMHQLDGRRPSSRSIRDYSRQIDIYGDDIIVPVEYTDVVVNYLESYALKVNVNKSFRYSNFRESCGADFYKGIPVNPVYARMDLPDSSRHWTAEHIMSWNATADLFYLRGMWIVAQSIRDMLRRVVRRTIPKSKTLGSGLYHFSFVFTTDLYWNKDLQCWKQKRIHYNPVKRKDRIDGDELACLNKWGIGLQTRSSESFDSGRDLLRRDFTHVGARTLSGVRDGQPGMGPNVPTTDARVSDSSTQCLPCSMPNEGDNSLITRALDPDSHSCGQRPARMEEFIFGSHYCVTEDKQTNPLDYLVGRTEGLDFHSSTKRGSFKSTCRWVSLAG